MTPDNATATIHHDQALTAPIVVLASGRCELMPNAADLERWRAYAAGYGELAPWESPADVIGLLVEAIRRPEASGLLGTPSSARRDELRDELDEARETLSGLRSAIEDAEDTASDLSDMVHKAERALA